VLPLLYELLLLERELLSGVKEREGVELLPTELPRLPNEELLPDVLPLVTVVRVELSRFTEPLPKPLLPCELPLWLPLPKELLPRLLLPP